MAGKPANSGSKKPVSKPVSATPVRNSPVPKSAAKPAAKPAAAAAVQKKQVSHADIARRAYEIWASGQGGSETENWLRAERELRSL